MPHPPFSQIVSYGSLVEQLGCHEVLGNVFCRVLDDVVLHKELYALGQWRDGGEGRENWKVEGILKAKSHAEKLGKVPSKYLHEHTVWL